jgi:hypothetical protein
MSSDITSSPAEVAVTVNGVARALAAGSSLRDLIRLPSKSMATWCRARHWPTARSWAESGSRS